MSRSIKKGPFVDPKLLARIEKMNEENKKEVLKTWSRASTIFPQMVRSAGNSAQLMAKEGKYAHVRLPSNEMRLVSVNCKATIGQIGNSEHENIKLGKAGKSRWLGKRPEVRGSVMNPNDHPHGGGEGRSPVGRPGPVTPWGKPALGYKTRNKKKASNKFIVKRRNSK